MKKITLILFGMLFCSMIYGQTGTRITQLTESTSADDNSLLMIREGSTGNVIKKITKANLFDGLITEDDTASMLSPYVLETDAVAGSEVYVEQSAVEQWIAPNIGMGNAGDTVLFSYQDTVFRIRHGGDYNIVIDSVVCFVNYGADIDINAYTDRSMAFDSATELFTDDLTVTSSTTGNVTVAFDLDTIYPGDCFCIVVKQCTAQPTWFVPNIYIHRE